MEKLEERIIQEKYLAGLKANFKGLSREDQRKDIQRVIDGIKNWIETTDRSSFPGFDWEHADILAKSMIDSMENSLLLQEKK